MEELSSRNVARWLRSAAERGRAELLNERQARGAALRRALLAALPKDNAAGASDADAERIAAAVLALEAHAGGALPVDDDDAAAAAPACGLAGSYTMLYVDRRDPLGALLAAPAKAGLAPRVTGSVAENESVRTEVELSNGAALVALSGSIGPAARPFVREAVSRVDVALGPLATRDLPLPVPGGLVRRVAVTFADGDLLVARVGGASAAVFRREG